MDNGGLLGGNPLLNIGLGILANNTGNYGRAGPALGRGFQQGMAQTQQAEIIKQRQQAFDMQTKQAEDEMRRMQQQQEAQNKLRLALTPKVNTMGPMQSEEERFSPMPNMGAVNQAMIDYDPVGYAKELTGIGNQTKYGMAPRVAINPATNKPEYVQFSDTGIPKFTGVTPSQDELKVAELIDKGILPPDYAGPVPRGLTSPSAPNLPTNNFNLPGGVSWSGADFGAPGTTATDMREGTTTQASVNVTDPRNGVPLTAAERKAPLLSPAQRRELALEGEKAQILTPKEQADIDKLNREKEDTDRKRQEAEAFKQTMGKVVIDKIDDVMGRIDRSTAGIGGRVLSSVPGSDAYDLRSDLDTIKANFGFDRLQAMRDMSPTGGALGQVAVQELSMLQASVANMDASQSPAQLKKNLEKAKTHYENWLNTLSGDKQKIMSGNEPMSSIEAVKLPPNPTARTLKKGTVYETPKGALRWNGFKFEDI
jgi:hypothetical protein